MTKRIISLGYISSIIIVAVMTLISFAYAQSLELKLLMQTYTNDKYYNCVCWLTSHNSFAHNRDKTGAINNTFYLHPNQILNIKEQLEFGVRGFMIDLYENDDKNKPIILSHRRTETSWDNYDQDFLYPFLHTIKEWLNDPENADDIITLHLESYVRSYKKIIDVIDALDIRDENKNVLALKSFLFDLCEYSGGASKTGRAECVWPNSKKTIKWPTLGEMRRTNKRLIIFSDKTEDAGYGIMHVSNTMETQYDLSEFPICEKRSEGRKQNAPIFIMNHFHKYIVVPGISLLYDYDKVNTRGALLLRAGACCLQESQCPNFIAIDNVGSTKDRGRQIVLAINEYNEKCCITVQVPIIETPNLQQKEQLVEIIVKNEDGVDLEENIKEDLKEYHDEL